MGCVLPGSLLSQAQGGVGAPRLNVCVICTPKYRRLFNTWGASSVPAESEQEVDRPRVDLTLALDVLGWVRQRTGTGDPFTGESQAVELALARLRQEQQFIQAHAKQEGVPFDAEAFWSLYEDAIEKSTPTRRGR